MEGPSPDIVAKFVAEDFFSIHPSIASADARRDLTNRIETALRAAIRDEREWCAALCETRRNLWRGTEDRSGVPDPLRREAQARANEAIYIADAIRALRR